MLLKKIIPNFAQGQEVKSVISNKRLHCSITNLKVSLIIIHELKNTDY